MQNEAGLQAVKESEAAEKVSGSPFSKSVLSGIYLAQKQVCCFRLRIMNDMSKY